MPALFERYRQALFDVTAPVNGHVEVALIKRYVFLKLLGLGPTAEINGEVDKAIGPILFRPEEDLTRPYELYALIEEYTTSGIKTTFGLTLKDFMLLPYHEAELLMEIGRRKMKTASDTVGNILGDME